MTKSLGNLLTVVFCTALAWGVAALVNPANAHIAGLPTLPLLAVIAFAIQWLMFVPAFISKTEHYYDLTGSATYLALVWAALLFGNTEADLRSFLLALLVTIWALRLGSFLFRRVKKSGKDGRFDEIKLDWTRFLLAWTMQGLWVFITLMAALIAIAAPEPSGFDLWAGVGAVLWLVGFGIEATADAQKSRFKANPENAGKFIRSGLWRWSRHPNYFGEILLWLGICIIAIPTFSNWQWLGLISPVFVFVLLNYISGVPLLEERAKDQWGDDPEYQNYRDNTPVLFPRPPRA